MSRLPLLAVLAFALVAFPTVPATSASDADRCQSFDADCSFVCRAGDVVVVSGINGPAAGGCGGVEASCDGPLDCLAAPGVARYDDVGWCSDVGGQAEYADCFSLALPDGLACTTSVDYAACTYVCAAEGDVRFSAQSHGPGFPRVLTVCGDLVAACQSYGSCEASGSSSETGIGVCLSRTERTTIACEETESSGLPARCTVQSGVCFFGCDWGDVVAASAFEADWDMASARASCGGATVACDGWLDCLAVADAPALPGLGVCVGFGSHAGDGADCFALAPSQGSSCTTVFDYDACAYRCDAGDTLSVSATSLPAASFPRVVTACGGGLASCQAPGSCIGFGWTERAGMGVCLSRTQLTVSSCASE